MLDGKTETIAFCSRLCMYACADVCFILGWCVYTYIYICLMFGDTRVHIGVYV